MVKVDGGRLVIDVVLCEKARGASQLTDIQTKQFSLIQRVFCSANEDNFN